MNVAIADLHLNLEKFVVAGMIINKSNVKTFEKRGQSQRNGVVKFVVRDSAQHFINLTVWGTDEFVVECYNNFNIEDIIDIINAKISVVQSCDMYSPKTSCFFQLTINEGYGSIRMHEADKMKYSGLMNVPFKPLDRALTLADVATTTSESDNAADLLVIVCKLKPIRETNSNSKVREVVVVDQTLPGMSLTIWNEAWIQRTMKWDEMATILHLVNVRFKYSEFRKSIELVTSSRTLIIENPFTQKSEILQQYARAAMFNSFDLNFTVDLSTITNVMSVKRISDRTQETNDEFYCVTYATVTKMDLDGCSQFYSRRCIHCNTSMKFKNTGCDNENCSIFYAENPLTVHYVDYFNIPVNLTDHTGTLKDCRLRGNVAEQVLGLDLPSFFKLNDSSRGLIKWKYLLERCCVKLAVKRKSALRPQTQLYILECKVADPAEVLKKIKSY